MTKEATRKFLVAAPPHNTHSALKGRGIRYSTSLPSFGATLGGNRIPRPPPPHAWWEGIEDRINLFLQSDAIPVRVCVAKVQIGQLSGQQQQ